MKVLLLIVSLLMVTAAGFSVSGHHGREHQTATLLQQVAKRSWQAASFRGLIVRKSTRKQMLKAFGKPRRKDVPEGQPASGEEVWYVYNNGGEFSGDFVVVVERRTGRILEIVLHPKNLSKDAAIQHFGRNYEMTKYEFCPGPDEAPDAPVFESREGDMTLLEYRERGIAMLINSQGFVDDIRYVGKPIGFSSVSECPSVLKK